MYDSPCYFNSFFEQIRSPLELSGHLPCYREGKGLLGLYSVEPFKTWNKGLAISVVICAAMETMNLYHLDAP